LHPGWLTNLFRKEDLTRKIKKTAIGPLSRIGGTD